MKLTDREFNFELELESLRDRVKHLIGKGSRGKTAETLKKEIRKSCSEFGVYERFNGIFSITPVQTRVANREEVMEILDNNDFKGYSDFIDIYRDCITVSVGIEAYYFMIEKES